jgi:hypothetical protein
MRPRIAEMFSPILFSGIRNPSMLRVSVSPIRRVDSDIIQATKVEFTPLKNLNEMTEKTLRNIAVSAINIPG